MLSQDAVAPLTDITLKNGTISKKLKPLKRARLLLDARTELTDEELKVCPCVRDSRSQPVLTTFRAPVLNILNGKENCEMTSRSNRTKETVGRLRMSSCGAFPITVRFFFPLAGILSMQTVQAPELGDFWQRNLKVQVETRSGILRLHVPGM